jgi:hypothetical protein
MSTAGAGPADGDEKDGMQAEEIIASEAGVVLARVLQRQVPMFMVTCPRVSGRQAFHSLKQAFDCYAMELSNVVAARIVPTD